MSDRGKHHGDVSLVGGRNNLIVAHGAAGLDDCGNSSRRRRIIAVAKWEEGIGGHHRTLHGQFGAGGLPFARFVNGQFEGGVAKFLAPIADQLALVDDNTRSARQAISVASTVADPGYWIFNKQSAGSVKRDFAQVQTGSGIHCYGSFALESNGLQASNDRFLIEVVSDNSLRIERQTGNCSGSPAFSSSFEYRRS